MVTLKFIKYKVQLEKEHQIIQNAEKLAELDDALEQLKENFFVSLNYIERAAPGWIEMADSHSPPDIINYSAHTDINTGFLNGMNYQDGAIRLKTRELHKWKDLYIHNGPSEALLTHPIDLGIKILKQEGEHGLVVWNGNLPYGYQMYENDAISRLNNEFGDDFRYSTAIIVGNAASRLLFGLEKDGVVSTEKFYQSVLEQAGMDPDQILPKWTPKEQAKDFEASAFRSLEKKVQAIPIDFFKKGIFEYGVKKPEDRINLLPKK